jgi:DNA-binding beta-propeller fold protein YncE
MGNASGPMHDPNAFTPADATALNQAAQNVFSDPSPDSAQQFASGVQAWVDSSTALKNAATSGDFAVDPAGGQAYVDAYNTCLSKVPVIKRKIHNIVSEYKLGTSPGAKLVAPWNLQVAQELETAFNQLETVYTNARDAYAAAMKNYQENEESVTFTLQRSGEQA